MWTSWRTLPRVSIYGLTPTNNNPRPSEIKAPPICLLLVSLILAGETYGDGGLAPPGNADKIEDLMRRLGSSRFEDRERAARSLETLGDSVLPFLHRAASQSDQAEIRRRASDIANVIVNRASEGQEVKRLRGPDNTVSRALFLPDGKRIVFGSEGDNRDTSIRLWSIERDAEIGRLNGHLASIGALAVSPCGTRLLSGGFHTINGQDYTVRLWDLEKNQQLLQIEAHDLPIRSVAFSTDGRYALSTSGGSISKDKTSIPVDCVTKVWDLANGKQIQRLEGHEKLVSQAIFLDDDRSILSSSWDGTLRLWSRDPGREVRRIVDKGAISGFVVSPDGRRLVVFGGFHLLKDGRVIMADNSHRVIDLESGAMKNETRDHAGVVLAAAFSPDGRRILTGKSDRKVQLWDAETGHEVRRFLMHAKDEKRSSNVAVVAVAFSKDGRKALAASRDGSVQIWQLPN